MEDGNYGNYGNYGISSSSTPLVEWVDDAAKFRNSLNELKAFSSHLYRIAYYCETAFCTPRNTKPLIVESTKEYVSRAVVTMVDHLGSISATLELGLSTSNSLLPQTQRRIHILQHRIQACQQYPQKLALARLGPNAPAHLSTLHSRYIIWKQDPTMMTSASTCASRASHIMSCCVDDANNTQGIQIQAKEPLLNYCQKDHVVHDSSIMGEQNNRGSASLTVGSFRDYKNVVPPVHDGLWTPPQEHDSKFQFQLQEQESSIMRPPKGSSSAIKSKALILQLQKKGPRPREIAAALIRRGKRILA